jgi:hypothetical protein
MEDLEAVGTARLETIIEEWCTVRKGGHDPIGIGCIGSEVRHFESGKGEGVGLRESTAGQLSSSMKDG